MLQVVWLVLTNQSLLIQSSDTKKEVWHRLEIRFVPKIKMSRILNIFWNSQNGFPSWVMFKRVL